MRQPLAALLIVLAGAGALSSAMAAQSPPGGRAAPTLPPGAEGAVARQPRTDYGPVTAALTRFIAHEMRDKALPALSIALVEDQRLIWATGFGYARPVDSVPATAQTIYRVGSVSKLFTDIAIMQLVERGQLDLNAPVTRYLPSFRPRTAFGTSVTLRALMSHRAGLVREPPVGHYFDSTSPPLCATVGSLDSTSLVYAPQTHTKYSNAGIAAVGYVLEVTQREPFEQYVRRAVLEPMGLTSSFFAPDSSVIRMLAAGSMWTYDGRTFPAPTFELGMAPAGSMYSSVTDLARFLSVLFAGGRGARGQVLQPGSLAAMWTPQFARLGDSTGFGLGFALSRLDGQRVVGHGGAIYGFATQLSALPDTKLGVVVATTMDGANSVTSRVATAALRLMLAARERRALPMPDTTGPVPIEMARRAAGRYGEGERAMDLIESNGALYAERVAGGIRAALRMLRDTLVIDDRLAYGMRLVWRDSMLLVGTDSLPRRLRPPPAPAPAAWQGLIGEYGWDFNTLYIREKNGALNALIEWFFSYPLVQQSASSFRFPAWGLYDGEDVVFTRDVAGRATRVRIGGVTFPRRATGPDDGSQFRITPVRPVAELRRAARAATPPRERGPFAPSDLVALRQLDSTIRLDIRYATSNNFLGVPLYEAPRALLQRSAADALVRASQWLRMRGYGLLVYDAYRPWFVTKMFWDATPPDQRIFVADPSQGSRHNRGCAVDLTLYDRATGQPVAMVGGYDEFTARSYPAYPGGTSLQRWNRALLRTAMEMQGFTVYEAEWWHFDCANWRRYGIGNMTFSEAAPVK